VSIYLFSLGLLFLLILGIQDNIFTLPSINVQTSLYKTWHLEDGCHLVSIHPPNQPIKIFVKDKQVIACPYKTGWEGAKDEISKLDDLKKVHHQVNCTNTLLQSIVEQLIDVSTKIYSQKGKIGLGEASSSIHNLAENISKLSSK